MKRWAGILCLSAGLYCGGCENPRHEYYSVYGDARACATPNCGGFFFKKINAATTRCFDGTEKSECYAYALDFSSMNLNFKETNRARSFAQRGHAVLRGEFVRGNDGADVPNFFVSEVWQEPSPPAEVRQPPNADFYIARETGLSCVTHPCEHIAAQKVNHRDQTARFAGLELPPFGAMNDWTRDRIQARLWEEGVMVAGNAFPVTGPAGTASNLVGSVYYFYVVHDPNSCNPRDEPCSPEEARVWDAAWEEFRAVQRELSVCSTDADCSGTEVAYPFNQCGGVPVNATSRTLLWQRSQEIRERLGANDWVIDCPHGVIGSSCIDSICQRP